MLVCANAILWLGLIVSDALGSMKNWHDPLLRWTKRTHYRLEQLATEREAITLGRIWDETFPLRGRIQHRVEVWSHDGRRLYPGPERHDLPPLIGVHGQRVEMQLGGRPASLARHDGARWSLRAALVKVSPWQAVTLTFASSPPYRRPLISFFILLLPLWLVVHFGLRPLRGLATYLATRSTDDLSDLALPVQQRELVPLSAALNRLLQQLRSKVQREHAFLQDAAHELRTPLAVISIQAHVLAKAANWADLQQAEQQVKHALTRAGHVLSQLTELAQVDARSMATPQTVDVAHQIRQTLAMLQPQAVAREMRIEVSAPESLYYRLELAAFALIAHNFLSNAIRYGHHGGQIVLRLWQQGDALCLSVADDGPGIPAHERERVFERFYRLATHETAGAGLGLAIVKQAATQLGAELSLSEGLHGTGCCFSLRIATQFAADAAPAPASPNASGNGAPERGRWFRPSLLWRILLPLAALNGLVWLALLMLAISGEVTIDHSTRNQFVETIHERLELYPTEREAIIYTMTLAALNEWHPTIPILVELWDLQNRRLYLNKKNVPFDYAPLQGDAKRRTQIVANGKTYNLLRKDGRRWSLRIATPATEQAWYEFVWDFGSQPTYWRQLGVSFLVLFPVLWLGVARGLRPLRLLSEQLEQRSAGNLETLKFDVRYAELVPIVGALDALLAGLRAALAREQDFIATAGQRLVAPMAEIEARIRQIEQARQAADGAAPTGPPSQPPVGLRNASDTKSNIESDTGSNIASDTGSNIEAELNRAIAAAAHLIGQLLDMARVDGSSPNDQQWLDCAQLVRDDLAQRARLAMAHDVELVMEAPPNLSHRLARNLLQLILHNLLDNAILYSGKGATVQVRLYHNGGNLVLEVADDGPGIAPEERERVFERFYRGAAGLAMADGQSTGLGLAIVRQAALRLGGTVRLSGALHGTGCQFTVILPPGRS